MRGSTRHSWHGRQSPSRFGPWRPAAFLLPAAELAQLGGQLCFLLRIQEHASRGQITSYFLLLTTPCNQHSLNEASIIHPKEMNLT